MASRPPIDFPARVVFGPFEYNDLTGELRKHGTLIRLRGQPLETLKLLLSSRGEIVSRDDLRRKLWDDSTFIDFEHGLNAAVNRLRQVLTDSAEEPRYIQTVAGRGYRFIAPIEFVPDPLANAPNHTDDDVATPQHTVTALRQRIVPRSIWLVAALVVPLLVAGGFWLQQLLERQREIDRLEIQGEVYITKWTDADVKKASIFIAGRLR